MKKKTGFTLSEVLITLTLIGIITTLTIPSLVASTDKSKKATTFKKAYNSVSGAYTQALTEKPGITNVSDLADAMIKHLNVKYFIKPADAEVADSKPTKESTHGLTKSDNNKDNETNWIITEDGIGYKIKQVLQTNKACDLKKVDFAAASTFDDTKYCYLITIDIDGPQKGNNADAEVTVDNENEISAIAGDRFYVYATQQGLTAGNKDWTGATSSQVAAAKVLEAND